MIIATIVRQANDRRITSFAIEGHAKFRKIGKDIICAGVSTVSIGTVNSIEKLAGVVLPAKMKDGWLSSDIPTLADAASDARMQLLLESMVVMLESIADAYGKYVLVQEISG
jgi:uncharacterized protein YsxB (DUF464 family)